MSTGTTAAEKKVQTLDELLAFLRAHAEELRARYTMTVDGVFGSFGRREPNDESDVDLLVSFERLPALWAFYGIADELENHLGRRVHLVHNDGSRFISRVRGDLVKP